LFTTVGEKTVTGTISPERVVGEHRDAIMAADWLLDGLPVPRDHWLGLAGCRAVHYQCLTLFRPHALWWLHRERRHHYNNTRYYYYYYYYLPSVAYDPEGLQKLDRSQSTTKLAEMTCHPINKAVMKQNCIEALNQHAQPLKKKAALWSFT